MIDFSAAVMGVSLASAAVLADEDDDASLENKKPPPPAVCRTVVLDAATAGIVPIDEDVVVYEVLL